MKWRYLTLGILTLLLVISWVVLNVFILGGTGGSIEKASVDRVTLNENMAGDFTNSKGDDKSCVSAGPTPDNLVVAAQGTLNLNTPEGRYVSKATFTIEVRVGNSVDTTQIEAYADGPRQFDDIFLVADDETVNPGEKAKVEIVLTKGGKTLDSVTRTAKVKTRNLKCTGNG